MSHVLTLARCFPSPNMTPFPCGAARSCMHRRTEQFAPYRSKSNISRHHPVICALTCTGAGSSVMRPILAQCFPSPNMSPFLAVQQGHAAKKRSCSLHVINFSRHYHVACKLTCMMPFRAPSATLLRLSSPELSPSLATQQGNAAKNGAVCFISTQKTKFSSYYAAVCELAGHQCLATTCPLSHLLGQHQTPRPAFDCYPLELTVKDCLAHGVTPSDAKRLAQQRHRIKANETVEMVRRGGGWGLGCDRIGGFNAREGAHDAQC